MTIFSVPFLKLDLSEDIMISTNAFNESKEEIISQAFKLHSQGNISEAEKYYNIFLL